MSKRKIATLALTLCMVAILAVGGSLAYFYDADSKTNVFTVGNVTIDLFEDFDMTDDPENDGDGVAQDNIAELHPVTYEEDGKTRRPENVIEKEVYVENTGTEDAYVRVHIAIPAILDNGNPEFDAGKNVLHFNYDKETLGADKWDWSKAVDDDKYEGNWNYYETVIDGIDYNVYVVTYGSILKKGDVTVDAMSQVYLDKNVTNGDIDDIKYGNEEKGIVGIGNDWKIHVIAEGCQAKGFANAYEALNVSFGKPSDSDYTSKINWYVSTINADVDKTLEEMA